jgi:L,D-peptidoglycan transpeptidase YkuD (ErfK/YbiS/YcfS/YnhG family)
VTKWDAWPDDVRSPFYNQHIVINPANVPPWHEKARMRLGDAAYKWLVEIRHNADPKPVPGAGSAIFLHARRGPDRYTSGCTAMALPELESIVRWLHWRSVPHYVLLPRAEYERLKIPWQLPQIP